MRDKLQKISDYKWLIPKNVRPGMNVDAVIYANKEILDTLENTAIEQLTNVACLPGIIEPVIGMPDMHWGYGLPMGAVGAFDREKGVISAGCTGFDINCGVRMLRTNLSFDEIKEHLSKLIDTLFKNIPCGVGSEGRLNLNSRELDDVLINGAEWAIKKGYGTNRDLECIEEYGSIKDGDSSKIFKEALNRGAPQLGTLGGGNHFLEVQAVDEIYEPEIAKVFGINFKGQITIMVHCGSRGLGHQVATDYLKLHEKAASKYKISLPDPQLVCAPANSPEGQDYFSAMKCAANYAFCNRQIIAHWIRESFEQTMGSNWEQFEMHSVYDVCHNICKLERHDVKGKIREVYVHRKGATSAFPAGHISVSPLYRSVGQPVLIAGSMGTASYVLVGTDTAEEAFASSCHGAGRAMSRNKALKEYRGEQIKKELQANGKYVRATSPKTLAEEAPDAYKDVDEVVDSVHCAGISKKIARVIPLAIAKG
ncbi:MAG: RtcB family protein [bacterium]|nr:RtcB family protein [bacterium]